MSTLRWLQPEPPPADSWTVYRDGQVAKVVVVAPDENGVRSVELDPWPQSATYWMTASNAAGESPPSAMVELPEPQIGGLVALLVALAMLRGGRWWKFPWSL